jgi:hypothetical protein
MVHVHQREDIEECDAEDFFVCIMYFFGAYSVLSHSSSFVCVLCIFLERAGCSQITLTTPPFYFYTTLNTSSMHTRGGL